jgi:hypothetical protein
MICGHTCPGSFQEVERKARREISMSKEKKFEIDDRAFIACKFDPKKADEKHCVIYRGEPDRVERVFRFGNIVNIPGIKKEEDLGKVSKISLVNMHKKRTVGFTFYEKKNDVTIIGARRGVKVNCAIDDGILTCEDKWKPTKSTEPAFVDWDYEP